jgi:hypothetical protein
VSCSCSSQQESSSDFPDDSAMISSGTYNIQMASEQVFLTINGTTREVR